MREYKLLKNLPTIKAGAVFTWCKAMNRFAHIDYYSEDEINKMGKKWFEEVKIDK